MGIRRSRPAMRGGAGAAFLLLCGCSGGAVRGIGASSGGSGPGGATWSAQAITAGWEHTCAVLAGGGVKCWGDNLTGDLGDGSVTPSSTPVDVDPTKAIGMEVAAAGIGFTCATGSGLALCWGDNESGTLGGGSVQEMSPSPLAVQPLPPNMPILAAGASHACAIDDGAHLWCWGDDRECQLGDQCQALESGGYTSVPARVPSFGGFTSVTAVAAGQNHTCAVADFTAYCWGTGDSGQLGDATPMGEVGGAVAPTFPVVMLGTPVTAIAAAGKLSCAVVDGGPSGTAWCWGANDSAQLGDPAITGPSSSTPVQVQDATGTHPLTGVTAIATGGSHVCAIASGNVLCWGLARNGQLGDGASHPSGRSSVPVPVTGLTGVKAIALGGLHSCALTFGGEVTCWGDNSAGQLGNSSMPQANAPVPVAQD